MDESGEFPAPVKSMLGGSHQVYPDGIPLSRPAPGEPPLTRFGGWAFEDMLGQPRPRLFTTHMRAENLPPSLSRRARLVMISRNPKDALVSHYYFLKKIFSEGKYPQLKQHLAGGMAGFYDSFNRTVRAAGPSYGDYYTWHRDMAALMEQKGSHSFLTFYELLQVDFRAEIARLAKFLQIPLPQAKFDALAKHVSFDAMLDRQVMTMRKGVVGDYVGHLSPAHWQRMDELFDERLGDIAALRPLRANMGTESR